jgi:hypothetical protein
MIDGGLSNWKNIATLALGLAAAIVGVKIPEAKEFAFPVAAACVFWVLKGPSMIGGGKGSENGNREEVRTGETPYDAEEIKKR